MAATHSYVITVGTTPVPEGPRAMRRAVRRGEVRRKTASHRANGNRGRHAMTVIYAGSARPRGAHRAGVHRAPVRTVGGRHRAIHAPERRRRIHRTHRIHRGSRVVQAVLPVLVLALATAVFVSAWFGATGAVAFASIVRP